MRICVCMCVYYIITHLGITCRDRILAPVPTRFIFFFQIVGGSAPADDGSSEKEGSWISPRPSSQSSRKSGLNRKNSVQHTFPREQLKDVQWTSYVLRTSSSGYSQNVLRMSLEWSVLCGKGEGEFARLSQSRVRSRHFHKYRSSARRPRKKIQWHEPRTVAT